MTVPFPNGVTAPQDWLDGLLPRLPSLSTDMVKHELLTVLRDFFLRSHAWQDWVTVNLKPNVILYSPELADVKAEICSIIGGYSDQQGMRDLYPAMPGLSYADAQKVENGEPVAYFLTPEGRFCIFPSIRTGETKHVRLYVSMRPVDLCVPDWIRSRHYMDITNGVLANFYLTPGATYNAAMGARLAKDYASARDRAGMLARVGHTNLQERVPYDRNFARGSQRIRDKLSTDNLR